MSRVGTLVGVQMMSGEVIGVGYGAVVFGNGVPTCGVPTRVTAVIVLAGV